MRPTTPGTLNSSAGFKGKRPLLGKINKKDEEVRDLRELPRLLDSSQAANISLFKSNVQDLQNAINNQDIDRRIRSAQPGFAQGQILVLRKWLKENWDSPTDRDDSIVRVLRVLQTQSLEEAFQKLLRIISNTDVLLAKATQLCIILLLKYDEALTPLYQEGGARFSSQLSSGVYLTKFNSFLALFERYQFLVQRALKAKRAQGGKSQLAPPQKAQDSAAFKQLETRLKEAELRIQQLTAQNQRLKSEAKVRPETPVFSHTEIIVPQFAKQVPKQVLDQTNKVLRNSYEANMKTLYQQLEDLRAENNLLKAEILIYKTQHLSMPPIEQQSLKGSYEECLGNELELMRSSYERRLAKLAGHQEGTAKELARKEAVARKEMLQLRQEKDLLMKKWQMLKA